METNFGKLNAIFMQNIDNLYGKKNGHKIISEYASLIKKNKPLLEEFIIFEKILNLTDKENSKEYIFECINYCDKFNKKELIKLHEKVNDFFVKNNINSTIEIKNESLLENIHELIFMKKSLNKIDEKINIVNKIVSNLNENKINNTSLISEKVNDDFYLILINKFNQKYLEKLTEQEKNIFKTIIESNKEDYEKLFEQERKKCLSLTNNFLKESTDSITKEKLLNVKEKLLEQTYKKDTFISDMVSFNDLINTLE